jgi:hypothetical protein
VLAIEPNNDGMTEEHLLEKMAGEKQNVQE